MGPFLHPDAPLELHLCLLDKLYRFDLLVLWSSLLMAVEAFPLIWRKKDGTAGKELAIIPALISAELEKIITVNKLCL